MSYIKDPLTYVMHYYGLIANNCTYVFSRGLISQCAIIMMYPKDIAHFSFFVIVMSTITSYCVRKQIPLKVF